MSITSQFYFCGMPFRLDSYKGCPSSCVYCFVKSRNGNYLHKFQCANPRLIRKWFFLVFDKKIKPNNIKLECLKRRMPIHFGGMSDPFLIPAKFKNISVDTLKILDDYNYPTLISTKANIIEDQTYADVFLKKKHFAFQISFSTFDDDIASILEPNSPSPSKRLEGAKYALKKGHWVSCRLQPYFPNQNIDKLIAFIKRVGFKYLTIEHFKMPFDAKIDLACMDNILGTNLREIFSRKDKIKAGREFEMPNEYRYQNIKSFLQAAEHYKIPIGIGDNGFQHLSTSECCCGVDMIPGFENWYKHNLTVACKRSSSLVKYADIKNEWIPKFGISEMINSKTRLYLQKNNMKNQIRMHWILNKQFSPSMFFNIKAKKTGQHFEYYFSDSSEDNYEK